MTRQDRIRATGPVIAATWPIGWRGGTAKARSVDDMSDIFSALSAQLASAAQTASASVVQVHARRRPAAGVVFDLNLVVTLASAVDDDTVAVRSGDGQTFEGTLLGRAPGAGVAVVRVPGLAAPPVRPADEPVAGHLALAVGRTWSGNLFAALAPVAVVGGPLRTGRSTEIARVVRVGITPHGALTGGALVNGEGALVGLVTSTAIRGTTVVIPAAIALAAARDIVAHGGARQGYIGVSSVQVALALRQRTDGREHGALVTGVVAGGPADAAGVLVGDVIVAFEGSPVREPEELLAALRGDRVGKPAGVTVLRGERLETLAVTVQPRPRG
jgi:S1-C subfamily serine protease